MLKRDAQIRHDSASSGRSTLAERLQFPRYRSNGQPLFLTLDPGKVEINVGAVADAQDLVRLDRDTHPFSESPVVVKPLAGASNDP
jgi:hypothetical protein